MGHVKAFGFSKLYILSQANSAIRYVCVCDAKKTSVLESCKIESIDGCSWEEVVGQACDCVGGPGGHLGSL